jgi:hypothetical protein
MQRRRPTSVLVIAIFQLIFGGLSMICGACQAVGAAGGDGQQFQMPGAAKDPDQEKLAKLTKEVEEKDIPGKKAVNIGGQVLDWVLAIAMIASGIGLLKMQSWARVLAIGYAIISVAHKIFGVIYLFAFVSPAMKDAVQQLPADDRTKLEPFVTLGIVVAAVTMFVMMIYPVIVLIVMLLPSVAHAFRPYDPDRDLGEVEDHEDYRDPPAFDDRS